MATTIEVLRAPIADSWRRTSLAGLDPASALTVVPHADIDRASPLAAASGPVLEELDFMLEDTALITMLVDREGRMVRRGCADSPTRSAFDNLGVDVGASLLEEAIGTTAPGIVLETRQSISVHGGEHFALALRRFSCYAHPIFHPTTLRIEGVLDLTAMSDRADPLLGPLVKRAVADIEQRLLEGSRVSDRQLLCAFRSAGARRRPVAAVGHDLLMSNQAAIDLLGSTDLTLLRTIADDAPTGVAVEMTLESGTAVRVRADRVRGARGGALLHFEPHDPPPSRRAAVPVRSNGPLLVSGPPGAGRSTRARELASAPPVTTLTAAQARLHGDAWAREFAALTRAGKGTICVDGLDLLPDDLLDLVSAHVATRRAPKVFMVSGPRESLTGRAAALAAECIESEDMASLANRSHELPVLVARMLKSLDADPSLHFTPSALRALSSQPWPGNLRELRAVLEHVVGHRSQGGVTVSDLPAAYQSSVPARPMSPIERAERDAIVAALREHAGNKRRTAEALGISRTTLYAKIRALRLAS